MARAALSAAWLWRRCQWREPSWSGRRWRHEAAERQDCDQSWHRLGAVAGCGGLRGAMAAAPSIVRTRLERGPTETGGAWGLRGKADGGRGTAPGERPKMAAACALAQATESGRSGWWQLSG